MQVSALSITLNLDMLLKKAKELAEKTIMEPEISEKQAESFLSEQELDHLYTNYTDDSYEV